MTEQAPSQLTVQTTVNIAVDVCWNLWINATDILAFNKPFDDWHTAHVELDLRPGGRYYYRMEKVDGSDGFDFAGEYARIIVNSLIESRGDDGRLTTTTFETQGSHTVITETVEPDTTTPIEVQKQFCQNILDSFKAYVEADH